MIRIDEELYRFLPSDKAPQFNKVSLDPEDIHAVIINEIVPFNPKDDFYAGEGSAYADSVLAIFKNAGVAVSTMADILELGIYITNAVKIPKSEYAVANESVAFSLPYLEKELSFFPNILVIALMGDVAKKMLNRIIKNERGKNLIPSIATYRIRNQEFYYNDVRILPSYIITGKNILIEKSKFEMASEDIQTILSIV